MNVVSTNAELKATHNTDLARSSKLIMIGVAAAGVLIIISNSRHIHLPID